MKLLLTTIGMLVVLLAGNAWGAAITSAQSGNWSDTATWTGGAVPGDGDTFTVSAGHTVTMSDTRTVGDLTTAGTVTGVLALTSTANLIAKGELAVSSSTGSITASAGAVIDQSGGAYNLKSNTTTGGTNSTVFTGTADNRVLLKGGTGKIYYGSASGGTTTNWAYVTVTGYTDATTGIAIAGNTAISLDHVRFLNTGKIVIGVLGTMPGASPYSVTNCDFRGQPAGTLVYFQKKNELSTSTRSISGNTFVASSPVYNSSLVTTRGIQGFTINDNVFYNIKFLPTSETHSNTFDGNIVWTDSTDASWVAQISFYMGKGNTVFKNGVLAATTVNWHGINISNSTLENSGMSYLEDSVLQSIWGGGSESPANVIMLSANDTTVRRNILLGTSSGILPVASSTSNNYIKNNTFVNYGAGTTPSTVRFHALLCEFAARVSGDYVFSSNLMYNNGPSANYGIGGTGGADLTTADYNAFYNILDANRYSNTTGTWGEHDLTGSVDPQFKYPTRTIDTYAQANGGTTMADYFLGAVKRNGVDKDGNAAAFNAVFTSEALLSYVREGYVPQNTTLLTAGEGGTYIGAVQPVAASGAVRPLHRSFSLNFGMEF